MGKLRNITNIQGGAVTDGPIPPGCVFPYVGTSAPTGYLFCDGAVVSQVTYASLFSIIGANYNTGGEGVGNFRLPDLRQRFILGKAAAGTGAVLGQYGGAIDHVHTVPPHHHAMGSGADLNITSSGTHSTALDHDHGSFNSGAGTAHSHGHTLGTSGGTAHSHGHTLGTDSQGNHQHSIDHDHGSFTSAGESGHTHTINHTHSTQNTDAESAHTHTINHDHGAFTSGAGSYHSHFVNDPQHLHYQTVNANPGSGNGSNPYQAGTRNDYDFDSVNLTAYPAGTGNYSAATGIWLDGESSHTHTIDVPNFGGSSGAGSSHSHSITFAAFSGSSGSSTGHTHTIDVPNIVANSGFSGTHSHSITGGINNESSHTHSITGSIDNESSHTHSVDVPAFTGSSSSDGSHIHASGSLSGRIGLVTGGVDGNTSMNSGQANPPYCVMNHIIKT